MLARHIKAVAGCATLFAALWSVLPAPVRAGELRLALPLDCQPGETCFVQNEVDLDTGPGVADRGCGGNTYDGHGGVDFRIASVEAMQRGVKVLAAAAGTVLRVRDGVADRGTSEAVDPARDPQACGNGAVVDHGEGWETQYCHLRRGSLLVRPGQKVAQGEAIGLVGLSGATQFPHVHLSVRKDNRIVDPLSGRSPGPAAACAPAGGGLFEAGPADALAYREGESIAAGFADHAVTTGELMAKGEAAPPGSRAAPVLLFYGFALNLRRGDRVRVSLSGPDGVLAEQTTEPMDRHKAQYLAFAGKKRRGAEWPAGRYEGRFALIRDGRKLWEKTRELALER